MTAAIEPPSPEEAVRLRGDAPRVMRLSRKAIVIAGAAGLTLVGGILLHALQPAPRTPGVEAADPVSHGLADNLARAPRDYSEVPRLGPPLPGDLGRPILEASGRGAAPGLPPVTPPAASSAMNAAAAARQRLAQEGEAARASRLFLSGAPAPAAASAAPAPVLPAPPASSAATDAPAGRAGFLARAPERRTEVTDRVQALPSPRVLQAGSVIPAALITGIRSDLPGQVTAQVTENVYDSPTGRILLIPQGARLIGEYDTDVGFGQSRVLLAWTRLILPGGRSLVLERQPGADAAGYAGLEDRTNYHWGAVMRAALISTLLGIGAEAGSGGDSTLVQALRRGAQDSISRAGEQVVARALGERPTLTIRPGFPVRVMVTRDMVIDGGEAP